MLELDVLWLLKKPDREKQGQVQPKSGHTSPCFSLLSGAIARIPNVFLNPDSAIERGIRGKCSFFEQGFFNSPVLSIFTCAKRLLPVYYITFSLCI